MYKVILTHQVAAGKGRALAAWCKEADERRAQANPDYVAPKRYMTVFGNRGKVVIEFEVEDTAALARLLEPEKPAPGGSMQDLIVPGMSELILLKEMDLG